jgi:hypothetical protein
MIRRIVKQKMVRVRYFDDRAVGFPESEPTCCLAMLVTLDGQRQPQGEPVTDYVRHFRCSGGYCEATYHNIVVSANNKKACHTCDRLPQNLPVYAAFFPAFSFAHRARWNAAIFLREAADIVRFAGADAAVFFTTFPGCAPFLAFAHLAFCPSAIFRRDAAEIIRFG